MKHVYTNSELPHVWAHKWREIEHGRNAGDTFYFRGDTIYSYGSHFPIARIVTVGGEDRALFTAENFSNTTSKHKGHAWQALRGLMPIHCVDDVMADDTRQHMANWRGLRSSLNATRNNIRNSRELRDWQINSAFAQAQSANEYAETFGLCGNLGEHEYPLVAYTQAERERFTAELNRQTVLDHIRAERAAENRAIQETRKAEANRKTMRALARYQLFERLTFGLYKAPDLHYGTMRAGLRTSRAERRSIEERVSDWKRGKGTFPYGYSGPTIMRIDKGRGTVSTSKGARFPVSDCIAIWPELLASQKNQTRTDDIRHRTVGMYRVQYIDNGDIKAGCHYVTYAECRKLAIALGIESATMAERVSYRLKKAIA